MQESYLGYELCQAEAMIKQKGLKTEVISTRSLRGVAKEDSIRVIRQQSENGVIKLTVSGFKTSL